MLRFFDLLTLWLFSWGVALYLLYAGLPPWGAVAAGLSTDVILMWLRRGRAQS